MSSVIRPFINGFMNLEYIFSQMFTHMLEQGHYFYAIVLYVTPFFSGHNSPGFV